MLGVTVMHRMPQSLIDIICLIALEITSTNSHTNLDAVGDIAGIVYNGENGFLEFHLWRAVMRVSLVLPLKLLEEGVVICTRETGRGK